MNTPDSPPRHDAETVRLLEAAIAEVKAFGTVKATCCDKCSGVIAVERVGDDSFAVKCPCGKFWGSIRGI